MNKFLEKAYSEVNDNIKFSEAKNAALITLNSALIAVAAEKIFDNNILFWWRVLIALIVIFLLVPTILSMFSFRATTGSEKLITKKIYDFLSNSNNIEDSPKKLMFYAYITKFYKDKPEEYLKDVFGNNADLNTYNKQMASQIIDLSSVAYRKFLLFNFAIKFECFFFLTGGVVSLIIIIIKVILHII